MPLPFASDALRFAAPLAALAALALFALGPWAALPFALGLVVVLGFFRDPERVPPGDPRAVVAAADGRVTDIDLAWAGNELIPAGPRVGVFLSVLDVHINRSPADGEVMSLHYAPGQFLNALRAESSEFNESNLIRLQRGPHVIGVRQIAGAIARRIVCRVQPGDKVRQGERIGLIRFGSRTEHLLPAGTEICVRVGDRVRAGETILGWLPADPTTRGA